MARNTASKEAVETMIKKLSKFEEIQEEMINSLKFQYIEQGEEWNDDKYKQLGEVLEDIYAPILKCNEAVSECVGKLTVLKDAIETYEETKI